MKPSIALPLVIKGISISNIEARDYIQFFHVLIIIDVDVSVSVLHKIKPNAYSSKKKYIRCEGKVNKTLCQPYHLNV